MVTGHFVRCLGWLAERPFSREQLLPELVARLDHVVAALEAASGAAPVWLDGQLASLLDYLDVRPEQSDRVARLLQAGRLLVGPWYVEPHPFLAGGEGLVRNLLLALVHIKRLGALAPPLAYLPRAGGLPAQLPQVLRGFGLAGAAVRRSLLPWREPLPADLSWRAPGQEAAVLVHPLPPPSPAVGDGLPGEAGDALWVPGSWLARDRGQPEASGMEADQQAGAPGFPGEASSAAAGPKKDARRLAWEGELRGPQSALGLSTRPGVKRAYLELEAWLTRWTEPLLTWSWLLGEPYPSTLLRRAWDLLVRCQSMEAVGGCSGDAVQDAVEVHLRQARDLAQELSRRAMLAVAARLPACRRQAGAGAAAMDETDGRICIFNPLTWSRREVLTLSVDLPEDVPFVEIRDSTGRHVPYQVHQRALIPAVQEVSLGRPQPVGARRRVTLSLPTGEIPPLGCATFAVVPRTSQPYFMGESVAAGNSLENRYLRVTVKSNGVLRIEDKRTGFIYDGCNLFEDGGDAGDAAGYRKPEQDKVLTTYNAVPRVAIVENGLYVGMIEIQYDWELPAELQADRRRRSDAWVACPITSWVLLRQNTPRVEIRTRVVNRARDHRLRVLFTAGVASTVATAGQPFGVVHRRVGTQGTGLTDEERPEASHPFLHFIGVSDGRRGLLVAARGLAEAEVQPTGGGQIALTLLRAGEWIATSCLGAEEWRAPGGQCLETWEFEYAVIPHAGDWRRAYHEALAFCHPPQACVLGLPGGGTGPWSRARPRPAPPGGIGAPAGPGAEGLRWPGGSSLLRLEPAALVLSAIKLCEWDDAVIVRFYNILDVPVRGLVAPGWPVRWAGKTDLREEAEEPLPVKDGRIELEVKPGEIVTLKLRS